MGTLFAALFMGHIFGDYVFQNDWMARKKVEFGVEGWGACFIHCALYSAAVILAVLMFGFKVDKPMLAQLIIFMTHFPIDKFSMGKWWMKAYGHSMDAKKNPFVPCVYIAVDNGFHLALMLLSMHYYLQTIG